MADLRFIMKKPRAGEDSTGASIDTVATPNTVDNLSSVDITLTPSNLGAYIVSNGQIAVHLALEKICNWSIDSKIVTIYSIDEVPLRLSFVNANEALLGLSIIENGINNLI